MYFPCNFCVLSGRGLCEGRSLLQRSPTECGVFDCDREALYAGPMAQNRVKAPHKKKKLPLDIL